MINKKNNKLHFYLADFGESKVGQDISTDYDTLSQNINF